jgi:ornithine cyclodeaminase
VLLETTLRFFLTEETKGYKATYEEQNMIVLNADEVRECLPMKATIEAMKRAYAALSAGQAEVPLRSQLRIPGSQAVNLFMPAYLRDNMGESLAVKIVSVYPQNEDLGLPMIHAAVLVLAAKTGQPLALLEGGTLTAIRTGAGSGAATDLLARPDVRVAAIFGAGVQARTQLEAVCSVRPIDLVWIYDPNPAQVEAYIAEMAGHGPIPDDLRRATSPDQAVADAEVICTATTSRVPVFPDRSLSPGVHINGVGSYTPEMREIPEATIERAFVVVDSRSAALAEAGDLIQPLHKGVITREQIETELGEIAGGKKLGRASREQITIFKSVGVAVQDAAAAQLALQNAHAAGIGQEVSW